MEPQKFAVVISVYNFADSRKKQCTYAANSKYTKPDELYNCFVWV